MSTISGGCLVLPAGALLRTAVPSAAHLAFALGFALAVVLTAPAMCLAQTSDDLGQMSIEELMAVEVTSASRKDERAWDVAAAVHVITQDDIRRSGMTTIPDLLRLVPGVQVARINASKWAVSVRGFNGLYANKLLVLVDGRSVYNRLFSGVLWDSLDLMLEDVDRIEVIRGPGAALWGANAVNGVINIVSTTASHTQGGLVRAEIGTGRQGALRYGGMIGSAAYRVHAQWTDPDESLIAAGRDADDQSHNLTTGFRTDWGSSASAGLLEGGVTAGRSRALYTNLDPRTASQDPIARDRSDALSGHLLARWTLVRDGGAALHVQSFVDLVGRQEPVGDYSRHAYDLDVHYRTRLGSRHDLVAGSGYRFVGERLDGGVGFTLTPADEHSSLVTAFAQDEIALADTLHLTLGSQVQYHSTAGAGLQPTARLMWKAGRRQRLWAAVSRALRTPSLSDRGIRVEYPPEPTDAGLPLYVTGVGNPDARNETLVAGEAGYRLEIGSVAAIDVTGFTGRYEHLQTNEPGAPVVQFAPSPQIRVTSRFANHLAATTRGLELAGQWTPVPAWHLTGSYTAFDLKPVLAAVSQDPDGATEDGSAPRTQWQLRSTYAPGRRVSMNLAVFHVGPIATLQVGGYTRTDVGAEWQLTSHVALMAIGQNLLDAAHTEFGGANSLMLATQVPRGVSARLRWTFR
jgi:iron complex outermembrane receptor protein